MIARIVGITAIFAGALYLLPVTAKAAVVIEAESSVLGRHLADETGASLYLFEDERQPGTQRGFNSSKCVSDCLILFPPVAGDPTPIAGPGVNARLIGSILRTDGIIQATYNGWPLYYFGEDSVAGDTNGHQFNEFGGDWYLIGPTGLEVGGRLAAGVDYQKSEKCGCQNGAAGNALEPALYRSVLGTAASTPALAARFADEFKPAYTSVAAIASRFAAPASPGSTTLASAQ